MQKRTKGSALYVMAELCLLLGGVMFQAFCAVMEISILVILRGFKNATDLVERVLNFLVKECCFELIEAERK